MKQNFYTMAAAVLMSFAFIGGISASAQEPVVLKVRVHAVQECFHAGPYAKYAVKYLGVESGASSSVTTSVTSVSISAEPVSSDAGLGFDCGLPLKKTADFSSVPLLKGGVGQSSLEMAAARAADQIMDIRQKRYQILTGDTDLSLTGETLRLTLEEFAREESELLKLFVGYTVSNNLEAEFQVLPEAGEESHLHVAFRISDTGLLPAEHIEGRMVTLELIPRNLPAQDETAAQTKKKKAPKGFRWETKAEFVPALCTLKLRDGVNVLLQGTAVVPQLGYERVYEELVVAEKQ